MTHFRWVILGLVFFGTTINYVDRMVIGILAPTLQAKYNISDAAYGKITAAFTMAYAAGQLAAGYWLDKVGTRIGYAVALTLWSIASALHAAVKSAFGFGFMRAFLGVSESPNFPAATKTLAEWFPKKERALAMGFVNAGTNVGAVLAPLMVPWLALNWGWQWAFIGTAALGVLWLVLWIPIYRRPHEHPAVSPEELAYINSDAPEPVAKIRWVTLLGYKQAWAFCIAKFLTDAVWMFYIAWAAKFFSDYHHVSLKNVGLPLITIYLMADLGSIGGGWLSSSLIHHGRSINFARKTALIVCAILVCPIVFAGFSSKWPAVLLFGLATAAHQGFSSNLYTLVSDTFPRRAVASVAGLGGTFGYTGATVLSFVTGYIVAGTGSYTIPLIIAAMAYLISFAIIHALMPRLSPVSIDAAAVPDASPAGAAESALTCPYCHATQPKGDAAFCRRCGQRLS